MVGKKKKDKKPTTTIQIEVDLVKKLEELGHMHDNYSDVIRRLLPENGQHPVETKETRGNV
jgi:predicted CopG family antitoxin